ncbi:MAG TPA: 50S ribosomal protein P1 [Candidatus Deferrimicrobium sp.]|nr:50S ribosomal protein P1 [Candidatus Deferrimicrobium sp.]
MEYVYASLLLHTAGKEINEANIGSILKSVGISINQAQAKSIVAALENVNIEEAMKSAAIPAAAPAAYVSGEPKKEEAKKEDKEEKKEEEVAGLGALFG